MNCSLSRLLPVLLLTSVSAWAQTRAIPQTSPDLLRNNDVLLMVQGGVSPDEIISRISKSSCEFDIFPPVIQDLRQRGVPDAVLAKMKSVPYGPPENSVAGEESVVAPRRAVKLAPGTVINIEANKAISSANLSKGSAITFVVARRVLVDGALVVDRGATVNGRVIKRKRPGLWGRGGSLEFALDNVVAVDGTRVPVQLSKGVKGSNHTSAVAAGAIITGAIVFPYTAPIGLIWGLKKGDEAEIQVGTHLAAAVKGNPVVAGLSTERKTIYHPVTSLSQQKLSTSPRLQGTGNQSFRPTPIKQR